MVIGRTKAKSGSEKASSSQSKPGERQSLPRSAHTTAIPGPLFAGGPAVSLAPPIQTKLTVNTPGDEFEKEADDVAETVARMPASDSPGPSEEDTEETLQTKPLVQRMSAEESEEEVEESEPAVEEEPEAGLMQTMPLIQRMSAEESEEEVEESEPAVEEEPEASPSRASAQIQRQSDEEEPLEEETEDEVEGPVQAMNDGGGGGAPGIQMDAATRAVQSKPAGEPLHPAVRHPIENRLQMDLSGVRVHQGNAADEAASGLRARAFTHKNDIWLGRGESPQDLKLMAHESAHVVQQRAAGIHRKEVPAFQRQETSGEGDGSNENFSFSEDEMEQRLDAAPAEGAEAGAQDVELAPNTENRLEGVDEETEGEPDAKIGEEKEGEEVEGEGEEAGEVEEEGGKAEAGEPPAGERPGGGVPPPPGPASEFESITDEQVTAYLEGNVSDERVSQLSPTTQALLEGASQLSEQQVVEPEGGSLLGSLTGVTPLVEAFTREAPQGYEQEEPWLQTVARVRDIVSALGGVVGMIGLVATVSGLILSLLIPPVGAFLLTAGRFCDIAALILDIVALALNVFLTSYNFYRLKNATDPEEKRRLLGLVRQDAMKTVMSTVAVATAVAPGAAKAIGNTRVGRAATQRMSSVVRGAGSRMSAAGRAVSASRFGRAVAGSALGRGAAATGRGVAAVGRGAASLGRRAAARGREGLVRVRATSPVRWANRVTGSLEDRARVYFRNLATRNTRVGRFYNRRVRGFHERNVQVSRSINDPIEREYHTRLGREMRDHLDDLQRQGITDVNQLTARMRQRFGDQAGDFRLGRQQGGGVGFRRDDGDILRQVREEEFTEIQLLRDANPGANADQLADLVNRSPFIKGQWTPSEMNAFVGMHPGTRQPAGGLITGAVPKTPHHTIPAQMAPQIHRDPRFMQIVNDDRFYGNFLNQAYPGFRGLPAPRNVRVPGATPRGRQARNLEEALQGMVDRGDFTVPNRNFFSSDQFLRELREQGSTGAWINPRNPAERFLFNPHLVIGHDWNWQREVARQIFDMNTRLGLRGEPIRQLLGPSIRQITRDQRESITSGDGMPAPGSNESLTTDSARLIDNRLAAGVQMNMQPTGAGPADFGIAGMALPPVFTLAGLTGAPGVSSEAPAETAGPPPAAGNSHAFVASVQRLMAQPVVAFASPGTAPLATTGDGAGAPVAAGGTGERPPLPPPTPVPYSPENLAQIRESRLSVQAAIEAVNDYIAAAQQTERDNELAKQAAEMLKARNEDQQTAIEGEQADISTQKGKLDESEGAQKEMVAEGDKASSETSKGESKGQEVQSEGGGVDVKAKPEEPRKKSWLERAWDATAGAAWRRLVRPVIRAAKRKVDQVMKKITDFITNMINQALGLDEIEAEINAGGENIQERRSSLEETDTSLEEGNTAAVEEQQQNEENAEQAESNIEEAQAVRTDAEQLLAALLAHYAELQAEEEAGAAYIALFGFQHRKYFDQQAEPAKEPGAASPTAETSSDEDRVTDAHVSPVNFFIDQLETAEARAMGEMQSVAAQSSSDVAPDMSAEEQEASGTALSGFGATQSERLSRLAAARSEAGACVGLPVEEGTAKLEQIVNDLVTLAGELEQERRGALQIMEEFHTQAASAASAAALP